MRYAECLLCCFLVCVQAQDPDCALSGFWKINDDVIARFWRVAFELGFYQYAGRGQCRDGGGRPYGSWSPGPGGGVPECRVACDASPGCVGFEISTDGKTCSALYDVASLPGNPPTAMSNYTDGDDATGKILATSGSGDWVCYKKQAHNLQLPPSRGSAWRVMSFPVKNTWPYGDSSPREAPLAVVHDRPADFYQCQQPGQTADPNPTEPFVTSVSIWWGTSQLSMWGGVPAGAEFNPLPNNDSANWDLVLRDSASWDPTAMWGRMWGSSCDVDQGLGNLSGQLQTIQHAVWGLQRCSAHVFERVTPELASLDDDGWLQVQSYTWRFGYEIFLRRAIIQQGCQVIDEVCLASIVPTLHEERSFVSMLNRLGPSNCTPCGAW